MQRTIINTDKLSAAYRIRALDIPGRRLLITRFTGSDQEKDFTEPANCRGFGRVRHFRRFRGDRWPLNPLPIDPASRALGLRPGVELRAQVFQNAVCNWRCWYCFVDFKLLSANRAFSEWLSVEELLDLYLAENNRPPMIDLTGGQPDLTPEWVPWMMQALRARGLHQSVYLWSDDNLSNDYFWRYLSDEDQTLIKTYPMYGRVCCFKGFDSASFAFNTAADPHLFDRQFELFRRLFALGIDLYAYVTLTCDHTDGLVNAMRSFIDRLQAIDPNLPLRIVPLEISMFTPLENRIRESQRKAISNQYTAVDAWHHEIATRFDASLRSLPITQVPMERGIE